eukprot:352326-Chlamydomonas_euryale.AAC.1
MAVTRGDERGGNGDASCRSCTPGAAAGRPGALERAVLQQRTPAECHRARLPSAIAHAPPAGVNLETGQKSDARPRAAWPSGWSDVVEERRPPALQLHAEAVLRGAQVRRDLPRAPHAAAAVNTHRQRQVLLVCQVVAQQLHARGRRAAHLRGPGVDTRNRLARQPA